MALACRRAGTIRLALLPIALVLVTETAIGQSPQALVVPTPPESILAVVIKGADAMHMVQHAWRPTPPTREQLQAARVSFDRVRLCAAGDAACAR